MWLLATAGFAGLGVVVVLVTRELGWPSYTWKPVLVVAAPAYWAVALGYLRRRHSGDEAVERARWRSREQFLDYGLPVLAAAAVAPWLIEMFGGFASTIEVRTLAALGMLALLGWTLWLFVPRDAPPRRRR
jgi:hypothetical protein